MDPEVLLRKMFDRAVEVADPMRSIADYLPEKPSGRVVILGAGKASARMAEAVEAVWGPCEGLVITRYGYGRLCQGVEIVEASHPIPDVSGMRATKRMLELAGSLTEDDFALILISGGASSLLVAPAGGITLTEKQELSTALLASGAPIHELNVVRRAISRIKGGRLAARIYPARTLCLAISDVAGDNPLFIGSGPTVAGPSGALDASEILRRLKISIPASIRAALDAPNDAPHVNDPRLSRAETIVYAAPSQSLSAAAKLAQDQKVEVRLIGDAVEGEARDIAKAHAQAAMRLQRDLSGPCVLMSGGELTVTRTGDGSGGPNAEYALALALALQGAPGIYGIACDTDGVDGAEEVAGAMVTPESLRGLRNLAEEALLQNDAHGFWGRAGGQIVTGPTLTNVNDFRAIFVEPLA
ncbi:MAG: glycerate kinase [Pseudomonadota bacterium]